MASGIAVPIPQCQTCGRWSEKKKKCAKAHTMLSPGVADSGCQDYQKKEKATVIPYVRSPEVALAHGNGSRREGN